MTTPLLDRVLAELDQLSPESADPELETVRLALLIEDVLGVTLTDQQISRDFLLNREALRSLLADAATPL